MKKSKPLCRKTLKNSPSKSLFLIKKCFSPRRREDETLRQTVTFQRSAMVSIGPHNPICFLWHRAGAWMSEYREKDQFSLSCCPQLFHFTVKFTYNNCKDGAGIINLRHVGHNWHTAAESGAWASLALVSAAWSSDARGRRSVKGSLAVRENSENQNVTITRIERRISLWTISAALRLSLNSSDTKITSI